MSTPSLSWPGTEHDRLVHALALQLGFVDADALLAAIRAYAADPTKGYGNALVEQGQLTPENARLLDALVLAHVKAHQGDVQPSLDALWNMPTVEQELSGRAPPRTQPDPCQVNRVSREATGGTTPDASENRAESAAWRRYRILRPHARGGLGEIFVAEDRELHREVALKEIQQAHAHDPHLQRRFLLEGEITGRLEHPGVVPVYGMGFHSDGRPFYAMRLIRGESLKEAIRRYHEARAADADPLRRGLALRQLLGRFIAACNAVAYAHSRGVIHRDLKPGNIMLGEYGETWVIDWGLAKVTGRPGPTPADDGGPGVLRPDSAEGSATQAGAILGTPAYMSPEQAAGRSELLGPASDIYGLGATLYNLLTGRAPVTGRDTAEVLQKVRDGEWRPPRQLDPTLPEGLDAICRKAMALAAVDRYRTALELAADVELWLAGAAPSAGHKSWPMMRLLAHDRRSRSALLVAGVIVVLAISAIVLTVVWGPSQPPRQPENPVPSQQAGGAGQKAEAAYRLGIALAAQGRHAEAEAAFRDAIRLRPGYPEAYTGLGNALFSQGRHPEATAAFRQALSLRPDYPEAHTNLGIALAAQGRHAEAEAAFRAALSLRPDDPEALCNLGHALREQGRFAEALAALRGGDVLGSRTPGWRYPSADWVRQTERLVELDRRLPAVLRGEAEPASAAECLEFAHLCGQYKRQHLTASRLYADAFAADPKLAGVLGAGHRYNAACYAALAAAGQGTERLPDKAAVMLRRQALRWLRADLALHAKATAPQTVRQRLAHWQQDSDLAAVRDLAALDRLPDDERKDWRRLWDDVAALLKQVEEKK
jgi:serine/threonine protein kinase/TolA-binding protein